MLVPMLFRLSVAAGEGRRVDVDQFEAHVSREEWHVVVLDKDRQVEGAVVGVMLPPEIT